MYSDKDFNIGKLIYGKSIINDKEIKRPFYSLNPISCLFDSKGFGDIKKNINKIKIGKIVIKREDENSLSTLGIKEDFNCIVD